MVFAQIIVVFIVSWVTWLESDNVDSNADSIVSASLEEPVLRMVTYAQFKEFVEETGYITVAERLGWSFVQQNVYDFVLVKGATWRLPDAENPPKSPDLPVTQVSYYDAVAYCEWAGCRLPTYDEYWAMIADDKRKVVTEQNAPISSADEVNVLGNVWEITSTARENEIRLAGGSLFCSPETCHGTSKQKELYVDRTTGNIHIGFAVVPLDKDPK